MWRPDGKALVVSSRRDSGPSADLHLLMLGSPAGADVRRPLTRSDHLDETSAFLQPRRDVHRVRARRQRLSAVSRRRQRPAAHRRLPPGPQRPASCPSGRLVCLWSQGKQFGIDVMDADGGNRETLSQGSAFYRTVAPSPDGRYLAATFSTSRTGCASSQREEVRLLDARGQPLGTLVRLVATARTRRTGDDASSNRAEGDAHERFSALLLFLPDRPRPTRGPPTSCSPAAP